MIPRNSNSFTEPERKRPAISYLGTALIAAFVMNSHWEIAALPASQPSVPWPRAVAGCMIAATGDVGLLVLAFGLGAVWTRNKFWTWPGGLKTYGTLAALGFLVGLITECLAVRFGVRSYAIAMPMLPGFPVGALPVLQPTILMPLSFAFANFRRRRTP